MKRVFAATLLAVPLALAAQTPVDFSKLPIRQPPLQFPAQPVEGGVPSEPAMGIYKPAGGGPFPAVVLFHHCAGVSAHIGEWAKALLQTGYAALVVDGFSPRGLRYGENCKPPPRVNTAESALDAYRALEHLAAQPYVDKDRIGLVGFSWGAMVALLAARKDVAAFLPRERKELRFRAIASLYPHCFMPSVKTPTGAVSVEWLSQETDRPLLVLMGGRDEETPAKFCLPRLESLKAKGVDVDWHVYPDATHAWDQKESSGHRANTVFGGTHTYQYSAETTQASRERVLQFFAGRMPAK